MYDRNTSSKSQGIIRPVYPTIQNLSRERLNSQRFTIHNLPSPSTSSNFTPSLRTCSLSDVLNVPRTDSTRHAGLVVLVTLTLTHERTVRSALVSARALADILCLCELRLHGLVLGGQEDDFGARGLGHGLHGL